MDAQVIVSKVEHFYIHATEQPQIRLKRMRGYDLCSGRRS